MRHHAFRVAALTVCLGMAVSLAGFLLLKHNAGRLPADLTRTPQPSEEGTSLLAQLPLSFVENQGQWDTQAKFLAKKGNLAAWFEPDAITLQLAKRSGEEAVEGVVVRLAFEGASPDALLKGERQQMGTYNYFLGNDPTRWQTDVPGYTAMRYHQLYNGIDLRVREHEGRLEYDLLLAPEADLDQVVIRTEGVEKLELAEDSSLLMHTALGPIEQHPPTTWYELSSGERHPVDARFVLLDDTRYGFTVPNRNRQLALVIDPGLVYSTFLGGNSDDDAYAVALDLVSAGPEYGNYAIVVGRTMSTDFPTSSGAFQRSLNTGAGDAFVTKLLADPAGSQLVYSTYLGGTALQSEWPTSVAVDATGVITVAGHTNSIDFPTTPGAFQGTLGGRVDAFITRLDPSQGGPAQLVYSTYLGGSDEDHATALAVDAAGIITVAGYTRSRLFPTTLGAFQGTHGGGLDDAFITRLDPSQGGPAQLVYSTYLGGSTEDDVRGALAVDAAGIITVAGTTDSTNLPTTPGAFQRTFSGIQASDMFITRLDPRQSGPAQLVYSTYLIGSGWFSVVRPVGLAVDTSGIITVAGYAQAAIPTTPGAFQVYTPIGLGGWNGFISRLDPAQSGRAQLVYSTYLGGESNDMIHALALDAAGTITVAGRTESLPFPTTLGAFQRTLGGSFFLPDAFVSRLRPSGEGELDLLYSTYLGGSNGDFGFGIALDGTTAATVVGWARSPDFPMTPGAWQRTLLGPSDAFLSRLDMLPAGVRRYGRSSSGGTGPCPGPIALSTSFPQQGSTLRIFSTGQPAGSQGVLLIGTAQDLVGIPVAGIRLHVVPSSVLVALHLYDVNRFSELRLPLPVGLPVGTRVFLQALWLNTNPCGGGGLSASHSLDVTVQP